MQDFSCQLASKSSFKTASGGIHPIRFILCKYWQYRLYKYSLLLGYEIPCNTCGKGLKISHTGPIIINSRVRIGEQCHIQSCVNLGRNHEIDDVPVIGNDAYIGPGAKLFGKITIADGCAIGAGAVVTKSFLKSNMNIVGNPAHENGHRKEGLWISYQTFLL